MRQVCMEIYVTEKCTYENKRAQEMWTGKSKNHVPGKLIQNVVGKNGFRTEYHFEEMGPRVFAEGIVGFCNTV